MVALPTLEEYKELADKVDDLTLLVKHLSAYIIAPQVVTVADISRLEGLSRAQLLTKEVYLLPNFGESEYPDGTKRWGWETYNKWHKIPAEQRKKMYVNHLEAIREKEVTHGINSSTFRPLRVADCGDVKGAESAT